MPKQIQKKSQSLTQLSFIRLEQQSYISMNEQNETSESFQSIPINKDQFSLIQQKNSNKERYSLQIVVKKLYSQNQQLKMQIQNFKQKARKFQNTTQISKVKFQQELSLYKQKISNQSHIKNQLQKEINAEKSKSFQLNKKNEFLQEKIKYQQEQINRLQQFLKIKEEIIQNFQWQKQMNSSRLEKSTKQIKVKKISLDKSNFKANQTLELSQINFDSNNKNENESLRESNLEKTLKIQKKKYTIGKGLGANIKDNKITQINSHNKPCSKFSEKLSQTNERSKHKNIVIKRTIPSPTSQQSDNLEKTIKQQNKRILQLEQFLKEKNMQIQDLNTELQNFKLKKNQINTSNILSNALKQKKSIENSQHSDIEKLKQKIGILKQKCQILQNQLQTTIKKLIICQQHNKQLEQELIKYQKSKFIYPNNQTNAQQSKLNENSMIENPKINNMITPQFRQSRFNMNFFPKSMKENEESVFKNIQIDKNKNGGVLDTFNRKESIIYQENNSSGLSNDIKKFSKSSRIQNQNELDLENQETLDIGRSTGIKY